MHTQETATKTIEDFLNSEDRCLLLTGTHQYKKHKLVMHILNEKYAGKSILFRINSMQNITGNDFLGFAGITKQPKAGEVIKVSNNYYQIDSYINYSTWDKHSSKIEFAIVYPVDAFLYRNKNYEAIEDLIQNNSIKKIFFISWTDKASINESFEKYYTFHAVYDAEKEDIEYHKRVISFR